MFEGDEQLLRELAIHCKDAKERTGYLALHAFSKGYAVPSVSEIFCVDESTIYRWMERWQEEKNVHDKGKTGRPPVLDDGDKKEIKRLIEENNHKKTWHKCLVLGHKRASYILSDERQECIKENNTRMHQRHGRQIRKIPDKVP